MYRRDFSDTFFPIPMRKNMHSGDIRAPIALIVIITVFGETAKVYNPKIRTAGRSLDFAQSSQLRFRSFNIFCITEIQEIGQIFIVRRRFAYIIEPGPHKLTAHDGILLEHGEFIFRAAAPRYGHHIIRRKLKIILAILNFLCYREEIFTARTDGRRCFAGMITTRRM